MRDWGPPFVKTWWGSFGLIPLDLKNALGSQTFQASNRKVWGIESRGVVAQPRYKMQWGVSQQQRGPVETFSELCQDGGVRQAS